jgi:hypothetical protein
MMGIETDASGFRMDVTFEGGDFILSGSGKGEGSFISISGCRGRFSKEANNLLLHER